MTKIPKKRFLNSEEVAEILKVSPRTALRRIKELNEELEAKGYLIQAGRVSTKYFMERFNIDDREDEQNEKDHGSNIAGNGGVVLMRGA